MGVLKRFGLYFAGLGIGIIFVIFFYEKKDASFEYGMDARTLKQIRIRKRIYSEEAKKMILDKKIDTAQISTILRTGDIDFSRSKPRIEPCKEYYVTSDKIDLFIIRCETTSEIKKIIIK